MITIEYTAQGEPVDDCLAERFVLNMLENAFDSGQHQQKRVSTGNVIQAALTIIARDGIEGIQFKYKKEILTPNEYGALHNWPTGFADFCYRIGHERLMLQINKRQAKREEEKKQRKKDNE